MRILLIPALALIMGYPAFAHDESQAWKYRSHHEQRPEAHWRHNAPSQRGWDDRRFEHRGYRRPWHPERERVIVRPERHFVRVRPLPLPPPPPVGFHLWFGF